METIRHGKWLPYRPEKFPPDAPSNALFARREDDLVDWYDYVNSGKNFGADTVKGMAIWRDYAGGYVVGPAVLDATMLYPANHIVFEVIDYVGNDPQADFGNKLYDPETGTFSEPPPPPPPPPNPLLTRLEEMTARLAALERK
jgi:hypothetical protein